jgi:uncharacterized SAM-binding protein YcdF (DUF218 family)
MTAENSLPPAAVVPSRRRSAGKKAFKLSLLIVVICAAIWLSREALLRYAAQQWVVSDNLEPADAIVILGGGIDTRPFAAAENYKAGLARKILVAEVNLGKAEKLGLLPSHSAINRGILIKLGVPEADIESFGDGLFSTFEEGVALREWAVRTHARSVIVPIEIFSSRRVRWMLTRALAGTGATVQIQALEDATYDRDGWWKSHHGLISFQNELFKYIYYRIKH